MLLFCRLRQRNFFFFFFVLRRSIAKHNAFYGFLGTVYNYNYDVENLTKST